jgi:FMNH2-dependent dimethyl sulfone monooxygenase
VFIAGESDRAIDLAARAGHYLFINGGELDAVAALASKAKRLATEKYGRTLKVALSAFGLVRASDREAQAVIDDFRARADTDTIAYFREHMDGAVVAHNRAPAADTIEANLGLHSGLIGDARGILRHLHALEQVGVDAIMVKCEPALESERFAREVIGPYRAEELAPHAS